MDKKDKFRINLTTWFSQIKIK